MLAATLCLAFVSPFQAPEEITYPQLLTELVDPTLRTRPPAPGTRTFQFSSYDRASEKGPADEKAWFANRDVDQYLRIEEREGRKEYVMAEVKGPGCITRIWSANPKGELLFYVDRDDEPTWRIAFQDLCGGKVPPFVEPLAGERSRGWNCHVPIPFAKSLRLACTEGGFYYHVNVRTYPEGTVLPSWSSTLIEAQHAALLAAALKLEAVDSSRTPNPGLAQHLVGGPVKAGERISMDLEDAGTIERLAIIRGDVGVVDEAEMTRRLRALRVRILADGVDRPQVDVPLGDFFATLPAWEPHESAFFRADETMLVCRLPIPFESGCRVELWNDSNREAGSFLISAEVAKSAAGSLRLHAAWHGARDVNTRPMQDWNVLQAEGPGWFLGCTLSILNPVRAWWGEGDEKVYVDGETFPSTFGTGTEDYFGYAWCSPQLFSHPLHRQTHCDGPGNFGYTTVSRFHTADAIAFQKSLRFDLELWHWKECSVDFATTAYWYAPALAEDALPALPEASERTLRPVPERKTFRLAGALEAERLTVVEKTAGEARPQDMAGFGDRWSGEEQLWWTGGKPGDRLALAFEVEEGGEVIPRVRFTKARDYATVVVRLDGEVVLESLDLYDPNVVPTDEISLGVRELGPGTHRLEFEILGKNDAAIPGYMVGIDTLRVSRDG